MIAPSRLELGQRVKTQDQKSDVDSVNGERPSSAKNGGHLTASEDRRAQKVRLYVYYLNEAVRQIRTLRRRV